MVAIVTLVPEPVTVPPVERQLYFAVFFGARLPATPVTVTGSPGYTLCGCTVQA